MGSHRPKSPPLSHRALPKRPTARAGHLASLLYLLKGIEPPLLSCLHSPCKPTSAPSQGHTLCKLLLGSDAPQSAWDSVHPVQHHPSYSAFHSHPQIASQMRFLSIIAVVITLAPLHLGSGPQSRLWMP